MQIHDIVAALYTDRRVKEFISLQEPADLREDLLHHCILEIYRLHEKYPGKIEALHFDGKMFAFFVGMVRNQNWSEKSTFFTLFKRRFEKMDDHLKQVCAIPDNSILTDDLNAIQKLGANFVEYFYSKFPERGKKTKQCVPQLSLF